MTNKQMHTAMNTQSAIGCVLVARRLKRQPGGKYLTAVSNEVDHTTAGNRMTRYPNEYTRVETTLTEVIYRPPLTTDIFAP